MPSQNHQPSGSVTTTSSRSARNGQSISAAFSRCLQDRIGAHRYEMWFAQARVSIEGNHVQVQTDSPFVARWIDANFADDLRNAAERTVCAQPEIDVCVRPGDEAEHMASTNGVTQTSRHGRGGDESVQPGEDSAAAGHRAEPSPNTRSRRRGGARQPLRRLEDFVVGESNRLAYTAASRVADDPEGKIVSPLFLHGPCGVGKTHLEQGACRRFASVFGSSSRVRYVTAEQFTNEYIAAVRAGTIEEFRARMRRLDLLAIDDVHFLSNKSRTQVEFLHTLDAINLAGSRVILASDQHPRQIRQLSPALVSRLLSGMVVQIDPPDRAMRVELVRRLAAMRSLAISDGAMESLAARCATSVRELEGAVTKLAALHDLRKRGYLGAATSGALHEEALGAIGMTLVNQVAAGQSWAASSPVRFEDIISVVCERMGVTRADLIGSGRHRRVVISRGLVVHLAKEKTTMSYPEIAHAMGRRNHSMVYTAHQRLLKQLERQETVEVFGMERAMPLHDLVDQFINALRRLPMR